MALSRADAVLRALAQGRRGGIFFLFGDEELGAEDAAEMRRHGTGCARCARYDRVLRRGLALVRELEPVHPSTDGYLALHEHLARSTPEPGVPRLPFAATIAVAGVVALVAWSALFRATGVPASAAGESVTPSAVREGRSESVAGTNAELMGMTGGVLPGVDVVTPLVPGARPAWLRSPGAFPPARRYRPARGPYTPLLLELPEYGQSADPLVVPASDRR